MNVPKIVKPPVRSRKLGRGAPKRERKLDVKSAVGRLSATVMESPDWINRKNAIESLGPFIRYTDAMNGLCHAVQFDNHWMNRRLALDQLSPYVRLPKVRRALEAALKKERIPWIKERLRGCLKTRQIHRFWSGIRLVFKTRNELWDATPVQLCKELNALAETRGMDKILNSTTLEELKSLKFLMGHPGFSKSHRIKRQTIKAILDAYEELKLKEVKQRE